MNRFLDRSDAGRCLAAQLRGWAGSDPLVLGLARGGVPVAYEVARALGAPLDVLVVRKLGVPGRPELAMGAVGPGGTFVVNPDVVRVLRIPPRRIDELAHREAAEIDRRERDYRRGLKLPFPNGATGVSRACGRTVIVVDDGLATGASMRAALASLRRAGAARVVIAVPTGSAETCQALRAEADDLLCLTTPRPFFAVSLWYEDFAPTTDDEVRELLARAAGERQRAQPASHRLKGERHA